MTGASVKPGTRCECREVACHGSSGSLEGYDYAHDPKLCDSAEAVRMVTVLLSRPGRGETLVAKFDSVPMCAPCFKFHEARQVRDERGIHCACGKPKHRSAIACDQCLGHEARQVAR